MLAVKNKSISAFLLLVCCHTDNSSALSQANHSILTRNPLICCTYLWRANIMEVRNQEHLAETAGWACLNCVIFAQNGHYLAYNGGLKGKKMGWCGGLKEQNEPMCSKCLERFLFPVRPCPLAIKSGQSTNWVISSLMHIPSGSRPLYITEILRQGETSPTMPERSPISLLPPSLEEILVVNDKPAVPSSPLEVSR